MSYKVKKVILEESKHVKSVYSLKLVIAEKELCEHCKVPKEKKYYFDFQIGEDDPAEVLLERLSEIRTLMDEFLGDQDAMQKR
jgi:hypothetical protein